MTLLTFALGWSSGMACFMFRHAREIHEEWNTLRNIRREYPWALGKLGRAVQRLVGGYRP